MELARLEGVPVPGYDPVVALRVPPEAQQWVRSTAAAAGVSSSAVLRDALRRGLPPEAWPDRDRPGGAT